MANYERGTRDPDDVRVFDGGEDDDGEEHSHLPVVIVISLLVVIVFGGVVWLAYTNGVARGRADVAAHVATAQAPATPPGTGQLPTKQIKVYQQPAGAEEDTEVATVTQPGKAAAAPVKAEPPPALRPGTAESLPETRNVAPPPVAAPRTALTPVKPRTAPAAETPRPATHPPAQLSLAAAPPAATPATAEPKPASVAPKPEPAASKAAPGAFVLQIGAYKSVAEADAAWKTFAARHAAVLAGFSPDVQRADLGTKGVWYRLRTGSFADRNAATALCERLKADGGNCFLAK